MTLKLSSVCISQQSWFYNWFNSYVHALWKPVWVCTNHNGSVADVVAVLSELHVLLIRNVTVTPQLKEIIKIQLVWHCMGNHKNVPILQYPGFKSLLGLDTLCLKFCLLFYSLMLTGHAYYSFQVHPLFSIMPTKKFANISFSIVLFSRESC